MIRLFVFATLLFVTTSAFGEVWRLPVTGVYDGDTINTMINLKYPLNNVRIRIKDIDAPEINGKCDTEKRKAIIARDALKNLIGASKSVTITNYQWDKYGGRISADVFVNGKNVAHELLKMNVVRKFNGTRQTWCERGINV